MSRPEHPTLEMPVPGGRVDRFTLERSCGAGGGGLVFAARDADGTPVRGVQDALPERARPELLRAHRRRAAGPRLHRARGGCGGVAARERRRSTCAFAQAVDEARFFEVVEPRFQRDDVQPGLVSALGAVNSPRTVALSRARSRRGPSAVQLAALQALEEIGGEAVIPGFMDALVLEDPVVRRAAAEGIGRLASSGRVDAARLHIGVLRSPHECRGWMPSPRHPAWWTWLRARAWRAHRAWWILRRRLRRREG